ncbi:potassium-transporting ATPase subunit F [Streptomyces sp. NPDC059985]
MGVRALLGYLAAALIRPEKF